MGLRLIYKTLKDAVQPYVSAQISLPVLHEPELFALVRAIANDEH